MCFQLSVLRQVTGQHELSLTHSTTHTVDLTTLTAQQLTAVKKQLDGEVEHLSSSYAQLAAALAKFKECLRVVQSGSASFDSASPLLATRRASPLTKQ